MLAPQKTGNFSYSILSLSVATHLIVVYPGLDETAVLVLEEKLLPAFDYFRA